MVQVGAVPEWLESVLELAVSGIPEVAYSVLLLGRPMKAVLLAERRLHWRPCGHGLQSSDQRNRMSVETRLAPEPEGLLRLEGAMGHLRASAWGQLLSDLALTYHEMSVV